MVHQKHSDHDAAYRTIFRQRDLMQQFIKHFVPKPVFEELDLDRMELVNTSFVLERLRRDSDCIWKINFKSGEPLYLLMLVEFQSSVDTYMAVRLALYIALLYDHLVDSQKGALQGKLPPTLSFVLYNGGKTWSANRQLANFYPITEKTGLQKYQLQHQYILLDVGRFQDNDLPDQDNILSLLLRMERASISRKTEHLSDLFNKMEALLDQHSSFIEIKRALIIFFESVLRHNQIMTQGQHLKNFAQVKTMFHNFQDIVQQKHKEGLQEGVRQTLLQMLVLKFEVDQDKWQQQLASMEEQDLNDLIKRIMNASSEHELEQ